MGRVGQRSGRGSGSGMVWECVEGVSYEAIADTCSFALSKVETKAM